MKQGEPLPSGIHTPHEGAPTVFVVDDTPGIRESLRLLFQKVGLRVACYETAEEFLEAYDPTRPGCLVLDVRMPGIGGLELQEQLAAQDAAIPIIIMTGCSNVPMAVRALKHGALDFIEKPFNYQEMLERVQCAIDKDARIRKQQAQFVEIPQLKQILHRASEKS